MGAARGEGRRRGLVAARTRPAQGRGAPEGYSLETLDPFWTVLLLRMLATAAVVVTVSLLVERLGPLVGALVATLPISAGPAYIFLAADHPPDFVAASAAASLLSVAGTGAFMIAHALLAPSASTATSLAAALAGWFGSVAILSLVAWPLPAAFGLAFGVTVAGGWITRRRRGAVPRAALRPRPWHHAVRAAAVMSLVAAVTIVGHAVGPRAAGFASLAPVVFTCLVPILQPRIGGAATASMVAFSLDGMVGYAFALTFLSLAAVPLGSGPALGLALAICCGWNALVLVWRRRAAS